MTYIRDGTRYFVEYSYFHTRKGWLTGLSLLGTFLIAVGVERRSVDAGLEALLLFVWGRTTDDINHHAITRGPMVYLFKSTDYTLRKQSEYRGPPWVARLVHE